MNKQQKTTTLEWIAADATRFNELTARSSHKVLLLLNLFSLFSSQNYTGTNKKCLP